MSPPVLPWDRCDTVEPVTAYGHRQLSAATRTLTEDSSDDESDDDEPKWKKNKRWQAEEKWKGDPDNDELPKWQRNQKWKKNR